VLYSAADARDPDHDPAAETLRTWQGELVSSAFTVAEADHLILGRLGVAPQVEFLKSLAGGFLVPTLDSRGLGAAADLCAKYKDLKLGLADASVVVLAGRLATRHIATFDERHFRVLTPLTGGVFELLPADAVR
jgi:uncharacterized protein